MARRNRSFFFDNKSGKLESDGKVVVDASNTTNILQTKGSTTGNPVALNAIGDDTNITINIGPKGSGLVQISSAYTLPKNDGTNGQVLTTDGSGTLSFVDNTGSGIGDVVEDTTPQLGGDLDVNGQKITSASNGHIEITPNGTGKVGIGTSSPSTNLHISATGTPVFRIQDADGSDYYAEIQQATGNTIFSSRFGASNGAFIFRGLGGGSADEHMRIDTTGKVGIGTTSPLTDLVVSGTSMATSQAFVGSVADTSYSGGIINLSNSSRSIGITSDPTNSGTSSILNFSVDGSEHMRIDSSGNVGIGNAAPSSPLTVAGVIESTSGGVKFPDGTTQTSAASGGGVTEATAIEYAIALG